VTDAIRERRAARSGLYSPIIRRLNRLQSWGLIVRPGRRYYIREKTLNSLIRMRSYEQVRRVLSEATQELTILDALPD
jgi:hypothetical protein